MASFISSPLRFSRLPRSYQTFSTGNYSRGVHILAFEKPEPLMLEYSNFRDAVSGKSHEKVSLEQGLKTLKIAEAILESAKNMDTVKL